jgi:hypothetical protein
MKSFFSLFLITCSFVLVAVFAQSLSAHEASDSARIYNIVFPIATLGNCTSIEDCRLYCSDAANQTACVAYAKQKGFYKAQEVANKQRAIIAAAKQALGCTTQAECKAFCNFKENRVACRRFAEANGLVRKPIRRLIDTFASKSGQLRDVRQLQKPATRGGQVKPVLKRGEL